MSGGVEALLPDRLVLLPCLRQPIFQNENIKTAKAQRFPIPEVINQAKVFSLHEGSISLTKQTSTSIYLLVQAVLSALPCGRKRGRVQA